MVCVPEQQQEETMDYQHFVCVVVVMAVALSTLATVTHAFGVSSQQQLMKKSSNASAMKKATMIYHRRLQSSSTSTTLNLKFIDKSDVEENVVELTPEQDQALRDAVDDLTEEFGPGWFDISDAWDKFRQANPSMGEFTDAELQRAYYNQSPNPLDLLTKTPLGPFILINGLFWATGFTWCDTPFHADGACPPL